MKALNLIWGFTTGGGIDKCFLSYAKIGEVSPDIRMVNVCIRMRGENAHEERLRAIGAKIIQIKSRRDFSWIRKLKALILEERPDLLFSHGFNGAIVLWLERRLGIKTDIILTYHGLYNPPTASRKPVAPLFNALPVWIYKHVAQKVICVSEDSRRQLTDRGVPAYKTHIVYNGISAAVPEGKVALSGDGVNIITCSRIDAIKGLGYLLEALARLKAAGRAFHYYMIGDGPELERLKLLCASLSLEGEVSFTGYQDNVPQWLNGADVFAITSLQENHSIAVLEAMRAAKAIVATAVGGNGESVRDGREGLLVKPGDVDSLYGALKRILDDRDLRNRLSSAARTRFEALFTEEAMLAKLAAVFKEK